MKTQAMATLTAAILAVSSYAAIADGNVVGVNAVDVPAGSDTYVSVPFTDAVVDGLVVDSTSGSNIVLTTGGLTVDEFADLYYVRFTSGALKGKWFTITNNGAGDLTVDGDVSTAGNGDELAVVKHWTLATIFPDGYEGLAFVGGSIFARPFEVRYVDVASLVAVNKSSTDTFFFNSAAQGWRRFGSSAATSFDDFVIPPQGFLILRNTRPASTGNPDDPQTLVDESTGDLKFFAFGGSADGSVVETVPVEAAANDTILGALNVFPTTLADLNLGGTPAFVSSPSFLQRQDELRVWDNSVLATNKSTSDTFYYSQGNWRRVGSPFATTFDDFELPAGSVIMLRKVAGTPATVDWIVNQ